MLGVHVSAVTVVCVVFTGMGSPQGVRRERTESPVARQVLLLQVLVVVVLVLVASTLAIYNARGEAHATASQTAVTVAHSVADSPTVRTALRDPDPSSTLQPYAEQVRRDTGVDFVVVMALDRTRYTHPDPSQLGQPFVGDLGDAPRGGTFTQQYKGTLGPSERAVVGVRDGGKVVGLVSVGITVTKIDRQVRQDLIAVLLAASVVLTVGLLGAWLVSRRLRRQTHGMGEREITRMFEYYSAVLHAVREGLVLVDDEGRVQLVNDEAVRLLELPPDVVGRRLDELGLAPAMVQAALGDTAESDDLYVAGPHLVLVSTAPAHWGGREVGAVVTLRDHTELQAVTGELDVVRGLTETLRSQTHESANRLHTVISLIEMGRTEEAVDFAVAELGVAQSLTDRVLDAVGDPVLTALLLGKSALAAERGIGFQVEGELDLEGHGISSRELVTVVGNLVDNAFDALTGRPHPREVLVELGSTDDELEVQVSDSGPGLDEAEASQVLQRGWTTKASTGRDTHDGAAPGGRGVGLALVAAVARQHRGEVRIDRSPLGGAQFTVVLRGSEA